MVVNGSHADHLPLIVDDVVVQYAATYLYLGAWITDSGKMADIIALHDQHCSNIVNKFSIFCQANTLMPFTMKRAVFEAAVVSSITYSSETWMTNNIRVIESKYNMMVRMLLGVRCLVEAGCEPLSHIIKLKRAKFLREKTAAEEMEQPFHQMLSACRDANAPAAAFIQRSMEYRRTTQLDAVKEDVRRNANKTKFRTYAEAMNPELSVHPIYMSREYIPDYVRQSFSRIRLQSHNLKVETGRWSRVPREQRLCDRCDAQAVQDEAHVLLTCTYTEPIRQRYQQLNFTTIAALLGGENHLHDVGKYTYEVLSSLS